MFTCSFDEPTAVPGDSSVPDEQIEHSNSAFTQRWRYLALAGALVLAIYGAYDFRQSRLKAEYFHYVYEDRPSDLEPFLKAHPHLVLLRNDFGDTGLHLAVEKHSLRMVQILVSASADVDAFSPRLGFPLHSAASAGEFEIVQKLLDSGADMEKQARMDGDGNAFHYACGGGDLRIVQLLLDRGANVNSRVLTPGGESGGATPLMMAMPMNGRHNSGIEMAKLLLDSGADPTLRKESDETLLDVIKRVPSASNPFQDEQIAFVTQAVEDWKRKH